MKRWLALTLVVIMILMCGCGSSKGSDTESNADNYKYEVTVYHKNGDVETFKCVDYTVHNGTTDFLGTNGNYSQISITSSEKVVISNSADFILKPISRGCNDEEK